MHRQTDRPAKALVPVIAPACLGTGLGRQFVGCSDLALNVSFRRAAPVRTALAVEFIRSRARGAFGLDIVAAPRGAGNARRDVLGGCPMTITVGGRKPLRRLCLTCFIASWIKVRIAGRRKDAVSFTLYGVSGRLGQSVPWIGNAMRSPVSPGHACRLRAVCFESPQ